MVPQQLFSNVKWGLATLEQNWKWWRVTSHKTDLLRALWGRRRCPLGRREGFLNVYDGAMNNTTEAFPSLACLSCVFKLVGEQLTGSCFYQVQPCRLLCFHAGRHAYSLPLAGMWLKRRSLSSFLMTLRLFPSSSWWLCC